MDNWRVKQLEEMIAQDPKDEFVLFALAQEYGKTGDYPCLLYTSPSPRDRQKSRMPSSA